MVKLIITAVTPAGKKALQYYLIDKMSWKEQVAARAMKIKAERVVTCENPFTVTTTLSMPSFVQAALFREWANYVRENEKVVTTKMKAFGAEPTDYSIEVTQ